MPSYKKQTPEQEEKEKNFLNDWENAGFANSNKRKVTPQAANKNDKHKPRKG